jgi:hypothetical protein
MKHRSVSNVEVQGIEQGLKRYPGRPFPPAEYGWQWTRYVPDWAHRDSLESRAVTVTVRSPGGSETLQQVVQYRVPLRPPPEVVARHAAMAEQARRKAGA